MADDAADERDEELGTLLAIYPELNRMVDYRATLDIPVNPITPLRAIFNISSDPQSLYLSFLPPLQLSITLPQGYPKLSPPKISLRPSCNYLPTSTISKLLDGALRIWEEYGREQCLFAYIDFLENEASEGFHLKSLDLPDNLRRPLQDYEQKLRRRIFVEGTYDCGICLEPKKGSACHKLRKCGHVFCVECLQDYFNSAIREGDVGNVKCLAPDCGMENLTVEQRRTKKQHTLHPTELLEIPVEQKLVWRYVHMKVKKLLEGDKATTYCPRPWCHAAARSVKYQKYLTENLEEFPESDDDSNTPTVTTVSPSTANSASPNTANDDETDRLRICSNPACKLAFCRVCEKSWHGDYWQCRSKKAQEELSAEEKASYEYIRLHTSPCPSCASPCQKTHGCNHMRCFKCDTHFCYLCSMWLDPANPYKHFNMAGTECYMRLWELEEGDEGGANAGIAFGGARGAERAAWQLEAFANADAQAAGGERQGVPLVGLQRLLNLELDLDIDLELDGFLDMHH